MECCKKEQAGRTGTLQSFIAQAQNDALSDALSRANVLQNSSTTSDRDCERKATC